jgi:hypothetical protein
MAGDALDDPVYRDAIVDLFAVLAYTELSAFERLANDASLAPSVGDKAELAGMAAAELRHFGLLRDRLTDLGADSDAAMQPFVAGVDAFHESTRPADWLEGLIKAYVGDGVAADFYTEIAVYLDDSSRDLVLTVCADTGHSAFAVDRVRAAIQADPRLAGRLALWGRRLVGEMLSQAQRIAAERDSLVMLIVGGLAADGRPAFDLAALAQMFARLTENHTVRMQRLGLSA